MFRNTARTFGIKRPCGARRPTTTLFRPFLEALEGRCVPSVTIREFALPTPGAFDTPETTAIATGPDGNLWFTEKSKSQIGRITPSGTLTEFAIQTSGDFPFSNGIVTAPDGNVDVSD